MLDDPEKMQAADPQDMARLIAEYPQQFAQARAMALPDLSGLDAGGFRRVVFLGMGGSGAGAAFAQRYMDAHNGLPSAVARDYDAPSWVDPSTLVIATSYSGNTEETLGALAQCLDKGASFIAITSGGKLEEAAKEHGAPLVKVPGGFPPRAAFGYLTVATLRLLGAVGLVDAQRLDASLTLALEHCQDLADRCGLRVPTARNPAKELASTMRQRRVLLVGDTPFEPCVERIRCQINENSKAIAFTRILPEANHNDTVSWTVEADLDDWVALWVGPFDRLAPLKVRSDFVRETVEARGVPVFALDVEVADPLARSLAVSYLGDWVSLYLAFLNGHDPTNVDVIGTLKDRCSETGYVADVAKRLGIGG